MSAALSDANPPDFDAPAFRCALGRFATGVTIITTRAADGSPAGLTVSSFNSVSLEPPLVLWSLSRDSTSLAVFEAAPRYVVNVLAADQSALARRFATGAAPQRFADVSLVDAPNGAPRLADHCAAWFACHNRSRYVEGDHVIFVGEVEHCAHSAAPPLLYHAGGFDLTPVLAKPACNAQP